MTIKEGSTGRYVKAWQEFLVSRGYLLDPDGAFGASTKSSTIDYQSQNSLGTDGVVGPKTIKFAATQGFVEPQLLTIDSITCDQLSHIMKGASGDTIELHLPFVNECLNMFEINTALRIQHFLSQCGHESASLRYMHEIASGAEYEGRRDLGNVNPGDGRKYRGRGPIQLTGRANYTAFFNYIEKPELIDTPENLESDYSLAWQASGWFWSEYAKINKWADEDNVEMVTRKVNGGLNGFEDRKQYLKRAKEIITD